MKLKSTISILFFLYLVVIVISNNALSMMCFCGQTCLHLLQPKSTISFSFHMRCPGTLCKSCDLEESLTLRAIKPVEHSFEFKGHDFVFIHPPVNDYAFNNEINKLIQTTQPFIIFSSLPLYLQNLAFLC